MTRDIGIRREDKHEWERRVALTPDAVADLVDRGLEVVVQPSSHRVFDDEAYRRAGAILDERLGGCRTIFAVKEIPTSHLERDGTYVFFSHTIKGQPHNMPRLRRLLDLGGTLIDYERIVDDDGRRLVFFGVHAGLAGMVDTLHVTGARLAALGVPTPFANLRPTHHYPDLAAAKEAVAAAGRRLSTEEPLPKQLQPFVVGFAGYGNVSRGAQEVFDLLPHETVSPEDLLAGGVPERGDRLVKVVFAERHLATRRDGGPFEREGYFDHPEAHDGIFPTFAAHLSVLVNCIYWTDAYPRLLNVGDLRQLAFDAPAGGRLVTIGDISCDIDGAIEATVKATTPGSPAYVFDPASGAVHDGVEGVPEGGIAMMTTDCLPCELPREASSAFTQALLPFVPAIVEAAQPTATFDDLPAPIRRATIAWRGRLTPDYRYLEPHLEEA
ncbi:MAG: hypothetical protein AAGN82_01795 [Myxococcota bacterium]